MLTPEPPQDVYLASEPETGHSLIRSSAGGQTRVQVPSAATLEHAHSASESEPNDARVIRSAPLKRLSWAGTAISAALAQLCGNEKCTTGTVILLRSSEAGLSYRQVRRHVA